MNYDSYRDILTEELDKRIKVNPAYSMRAFASKIGISPSRLSEILNMKQGLSSKSAAVISKNLNFDSYKTKYFELLVESSQSRSPYKKMKAKEELLNFQKKMITTVPLDQYRFISDWQYYTLIEIFKTDNAIHSTKWLANRLELPEDEVIASIDRLKRLELIKYTKGRFVVTDTNPFSTISYIPSDAIKEHHHQLIKKSEIALYEQALETREYNSLIIAINKNDLVEIKTKIQCDEPQPINPHAPAS